MIWSKTVLFWSRLEIFVDIGQNQRLQYFHGLAKKRDRPIRSSYGGVLARFRYWDDQAVTERLKRAVMYSMALGPRCFKWKMLSLSGPKALLFLQLLIALPTRSVVNVCAISNDFLFISLLIGSHLKKCLPALMC